MIEHEAERPTEDNASGFDGASNRNETEQDTLDDILPGSGVGDVVDELAVCSVDGAGGGEVFPLGFLAVVDILVMARFEIAVALDEPAIFDDTASNAGRKSQIEAAAGAVARFGQSGKIGVVFNKNWFGEVLLEEHGEVEILPRQVTEVGSLTAFDNAGHRDRDGFDFGEDEVDLNLALEGGVKFILVVDGGKFDSMENFAVGAEEGEQGFGTTDVDT